jgi:hypothetical protein
MSEPAGKIYNQLALVQAELKAPKGQFNNFGKYNYRSCEDIVEAVKPINRAHDILLVMSDTVKEVGGRVYVEAMAMAICLSDGTSIKVTASAREAENKKGMDDSQITGAASSYARKYALNGLFAIDDTKDADTNEHKEQEKKEPKVNYISQIKSTKDEFELHDIFKEAWVNTKGKEQDNIKAEYDKRKIEITELGGSSQAQRGE